MWHKWLNLLLLQWVLDFARKTIVNKKTEIIKFKVLSLENMQICGSGNSVQLRNIRVYYLSSFKTDTQFLTNNVYKQKSLVNTGKSGCYRTYMMEAIKRLSLFGKNESLKHFLHATVEKKWSYASKKYLLFLSLPSQLWRRQWQTKNT